MAPIQVCVFNPVTTFIDPVTAASTGPAAAGVPVVTNGNGQIDSSLLGVGSVAIAGQNMNTGALVNLYNSGGNLHCQLASAAQVGTAPSGSPYPVLAQGFISVDVFTGNTVTVNFVGTFQYIDGISEFSASDIGAEVYLSATNAGGITKTPPTVKEAVGYVVAFTNPNLVTVNFIAAVNSFSQISGVAAITQGGTGATSATSALVNLGAGSYTADFFYASPVGSSGALTARAFSLTDIPQSGATTGQSITWSGSAWTPSSGPLTGFNDITSGTNTTATMTVGSGAQIAVTGTGIVTATQLATTTLPVVVSSATAPTTGQVLTATSATTADWQTPSGGGGTPGAPTNSVQYNNAGAFAGSANMEWINTPINLGTLVVGGRVADVAFRDSQIGLYATFDHDSVNHAQNSLDVNLQPQFPATVSGTLTNYHGNFPVAGQATITATNTFTAGQTVTFTGVTSASWLNFVPGNNGPYWTVVSGGGASFVITGSPIIGVNQPETTGTAQLASVTSFGGVNAVVDFDLSTTGTNYQGQPTAVTGTVVQFGTGTVGEMFGANFTAGIQNAAAVTSGVTGIATTAANFGTTTTAAGGIFQLNQAGGHVDTAFGTEVFDEYSGQASTATGYGLQISPSVFAWVGSKFGLWIGDQTAATPTQISYSLSAAANASGPNTTYTLTTPFTAPVNYATATVYISGFTNSVNNGQFNVVSNNSTTITVSNANGTAESTTSTLTLYTNPNPASITTMGGLHDFNDSVAITKNVSQIDPGPFTLTGVTTADANNNAIYTGTITGGANNAYAGINFLVSGFTITNNNSGLGGFLCVGSTATQLILVNAGALVEANPATADELTFTNGINVLDVSVGTSISDTTNHGNILAGSFFAANGGAGSVLSISGINSSADMQGGSVSSNGGVIAVGANSTVSAGTVDNVPGSFGVVGTLSTATLESSGDSPTVKGVWARAFNAASIVTLTEVIGVDSTTTNTGSGTLPTMAGFHNQATITNATITNNYGAWIESPTINSGGSLSNNYGLYISDQTGIGLGTNLNPYAIFVAGGVSSFTGVATAIVTKSTTYTATPNDHTINCTGTFTLTLPTTGLKVGQEFYIKNISSGTITVSSTANIDFATFTTLSALGQSITVQWDGTQYWIY